MPSVYLEPQDYATYGVDSATTQAQVIQASAIIDQYLQRPEGLIWVPDGNGNPCYMKNLNPSFSVTVTSGAITAGNAVTVTLTGPTARLQTGSVLILDRANPDKTEACIIASIPSEGSGPLGNNQVILQSVQFDHDAGAILDFDLTIVEEQDMPPNRWETLLKKTPIANVIAGQGQLGYTRRGASLNTNYGVIYAILPPVGRYGAPPIWQSFLLLSDAYDPNTGRIWISPSIYLTYYTQIRMYYVAGYTYESLPYLIKQACASNINAQSDLPIYGNFKTIKQGDTTVTRWGDTIMSDDIKLMLEPYKARLWV